MRVPTPTKRDYMPEDIQYAVVSREATEGEMLKDAPNSSTATFKLVMDGELKLDARVPERYSAEVKEGQDVQVRVDAYPDRVFAGKVVRINPTVDRTSRTFGVQIYVDNAQRELKAGGFRSGGNPHTCGLPGLDRVVRIGVDLCRFETGVCGPGRQGTFDFGGHGCRGSRLG